LLVGGRHVIEISEELATNFRPGDSLFASESIGQVLHIPLVEREKAEHAVGTAHAAFGQMSGVNDSQISAFFKDFADRLADDDLWTKIRRVNEEDVISAHERGRSTTRLAATDSLRSNMIDGLRGWVHETSQRGRVIERVQHAGWSAELIGSELGVVGFVFEGRPNVVADATGVLRGGNTVVFRIGRDALNTAKAMLQFGVEPALAEAGLPLGAVSVVDSASHAAGWAMFSDKRLSLAVARGSGEAVDTLGSLAQSAGIPVSLHGTGGAWLFAGDDAEPAQLAQAVFDSLDRKVCNTLNTCCLPRRQADRLVPALLDGLARAATRRGAAFKLHVGRGSESAFPAALFSSDVQISRAAGLVSEPQAALISEADLGREWEWEGSPEVSVTLVDDLAHGVHLFNRYSPQFVACLVSPHPGEHDAFFKSVNAPFVGDGFTRWVDGQFALKRPELGLSNWQHGRLFGRGGVLSGDSVFTVRTRVQRSR
jgi:glutamate-5-semialdehyde dehydrogenase